MLKWSLFFLIFISVSATAQERDFIIWNKNQVNVSPWNKINIEVSEKIHYSPKRSSSDLKYGDIFIAHELKNWIEYGAGFRITRINLQNGNWLQENRPMLYFDLSDDINKFEFSFNNRFEYRSYKELNDYFRHRQAFQIKFPGLTEWGMQFYVLEESFFKLNGDGTHLARFYSGLTALDTNRVAIKIYYALQKQKIQNSWSAADILGLNLCFEI